MGVPGTLSGALLSSTLLSGTMLDALGRIMPGVFDVLGMPMLRAMAGQGKLPVAAAAALARVVIVGEGGAGKSTLLKQMLAYAGSAGRVPVWVPLSALAAADGPLTPAALIEHLVRQAQVALGLDDVNDAFFRALIDEGQLAIGFDALDECGSLARRQKVRALIVELARQWPGCQIFVTSRPDALRETPLPLQPLQPMQPLQVSAEGDSKQDGFFAFEPVPFGRDDVAPFLKAVFDDDGQLAQSLLMRTGIEALLETPLTLALVGLVAHTAKAGLPQTRTPLFAQCLQTVCETWEDAKGGPASDGLDAGQRLDVLRRLGWLAQQGEGDRLGALAARRALARVPALAPRAQVIVNGLARRNLLLRAETSETGEVQQIRFAHPQFREYLAATHLAEQFALDEHVAVVAMAPHWFDSGWLEVLRFAADTLAHEAELRDALLRAILAADDPYRDLLRRPEFLVARLAARLSAADTALLRSVVAVLEQAAQQEPALRDEAAGLLLGLASHAAAHAAIRRFAEGAGIAGAFAEAGDSADDAQIDAFRWRLRAIEALAQTGAAQDARSLALRLATPHLLFVLEASELRLRLQDGEGARAAWKACFDAEGVHGRLQIAASMDRAGEGALFDTWLQASLAQPLVSVSDIRLARQRKVVADYDARWSRVFEAATRALPALGPHEIFAPPGIADAVYAALDTDGLGADARAAQRALLEAALRHPAFTWVVGGRLGALFPTLRADAVAQLMQYVLHALAPDAVFPDHSRVGGAVHSLCNEPDDALAVPALRTLLRHAGVAERWGLRVAASLARRGYGRESLDELAPTLRLPAGVDDRHPDRQHPGRERGWQVARELDGAAAHRLLDALYRSGEPRAAAERLAAAWHVSGVWPVARDWFAELASDDEGRVFLQNLAALDRDGGAVDLAREALHGGVQGAQDASIPPQRTAARCEQDFACALAEGWFFDDLGEKVEASLPNLLGLLDELIAAGDSAAALRGAEAWVRRSLQDPSVATGAKAEQLAEQLQGLALYGLHDAGWVGPVADFARTVAPGQRAGLLAWLAAVA